MKQLSLGDLPPATHCAGKGALLPMNDGKTILSIRDHIRTQRQGIRTGTEQTPLVCVCIGSDGILGDALGPFIGSLLERTHSRGLRVHGTLQQPIHAKNLSSLLSDLVSIHPQAHILAIDACLGKTHEIGQIQVNSGPLYPGTGVYKSLPAVGDLHILGIVGECRGENSLSSLHRVRLRLIARMAEVIAEGILQSLLPKTAPSTACG